MSDKRVTCYFNHAIQFCLAVGLWLIKTKCGLIKTFFNYLISLV